MKKKLPIIFGLLISFGAFSQSSEKTSATLDLGPLIFDQINNKPDPEPQPEVKPEPGPKPIVLNSDVDTNIPVTAEKKPKAFAVVIGNSQYEYTGNVDYAVHDARAVKEYLVSAMGYMDENVFLIENATLKDFQGWFGNERSYKGRLYNLAYENIETEVDLFIYYAGHGAPDPNTKSGYFLPADSDPSLIDVTSYPGELLFGNIDKIGAKSTTVVLDACFSGDGVVTGLSAVAIKPKDFGEIRNGVVLSSSKDVQPSAWYEEKNHGLFTYYFLKALQQPATDSNGDGAISIEEVYDYAANMVPRKARGLRGLEQNPTIR